MPASKGVVGIPRYMGSKQEESTKRKHVTAPTMPFEPFSKAWSTLEFTHCKWDNIYPTHLEIVIPGIMSDANSLAIAMASLLITHEGTRKEHIVHRRIYITYTRGPMVGPCSLVCGSGFLVFSGYSASKSTHHDTQQVFVTDLPITRCFRRYSFITSDGIAGILSWSMPITHT